jgi:folate-dependent tRNA-U54 methylase TrmFO/GidA
MCFYFLECLTVIHADISYLKARYDKNSKECTSVAETEDEKVDEKVAPPKEKAEKVKMEEFQPKKLMEEELMQETSMRAEELTPEGKGVNQHL